MKPIPLRDVSKSNSEPPRVRTIAVLVPYQINLPYVGILAVTDYRLRRGFLVDGPDSGEYQIGDLVDYSDQFGSELPVVIAGYGPF